jgi:Zn-dependent M28 family amino/carboxypeptidase
MKADKERMYKDVDFLTKLDPPRNYENIESLEEAALYIEEEFSKAGFETGYQYFEADGHLFRNIIVSYNPEKKKRLIVGAHYDVCCDFPGADDNATGVAGLLECARLIAMHKPETDYRIDFVAFCPEEPPFFRTPDMGSVHHVSSLLPFRKDVLGMICLDMIGYFSEEQGSQDLPLAELRNRFPDRGDFIIVAGQSHQREFAEKITGLIQQNCAVKAYTVTDPRLKNLLELSDHLNYWKYGFNAVMINDTAKLRNKNYHTESDTIEKLDFGKMAEVVSGCYNAITSYCGD